MTIGLPEYRDERVNYMHWMIILPFIRGRRPESGESEERQTPLEVP